jgi:hypothetical protein
MSDKRYWIAINGPTCAISSFPFRNPMVTPTPQVMFGFPTYEEAQHAQRILLGSSNYEASKFFKSFVPDVRLGRIRIINPEHPQPHVSQPSDPTMWTESPEVHAAVQREFIKTTSN